MNYIINFYKKSKYFGFVRCEYKEFNSYQEAYNYIDLHKIKSSDYDIYAKVIL